MTPDGGGSLLDLLLGGLATAGAVILGLVKRQANRVEKLAESALPRADFKEHETRVRNEIKELYGRDDEIKAAIHTECTAIRREMNDGFNRLSDQLRAK